MNFRKHDPDAPDGFYATEAAGLGWLAVPGGVPVARVLAVSPGSIELVRLPVVGASAAAAVELGRRLAATHAAGAEFHGAGPPGAPGGFIGPLPMPVPDTDPGGWGPFYAMFRVEPFAARAESSGALDRAGGEAVRAVCARLRDGDAGLTGPDVAPARLHGDLWSGNVLWTADGAVLIDPAAHGGHPETDLAMLELFGLPHLDDVLAGYAAVLPLPGREGRVGLHQLFPLLVHAVLFGPSYGAQAGAVAAQLL